MLALFMSRMPRMSGSHIVNTPHGPKTKNATENLKNLITPPKTLLVPAKYKKRDREQ